MLETKIIEYQYNIAASHIQLTESLKTVGSIIKTENIIIAMVP